MAKLLEKIVQSQLMEFLLSHDLLTCHQSAFRKGHSTETALYNVITQLLDSANDGLISGTGYFGLEKCFDTIDHDILIHKLHTYGIMKMNWSGSSDLFNCLNSLVRTPLCKVVSACPATYRSHYPSFS